MSKTNGWANTAAALLCAIMLAACGDDGEGGAAPTCDDPAVRAAEPLCALDDVTVRCDFLVPEHCLLPFPSSVFLTADASTGTGFRVQYDALAMPANIAGVHIDPTEWRTLDGFSPGPVIMALFPQGVDLAASGVPSLWHIERSLEHDSPTVVMDAQSGERVPHFAELDTQASSPATAVFIIRPVVRLRNSTRYLVAIRGLVDPNGEPIEANRAFAILRDSRDTPVRSINERRAAMEDVFEKLQAAGIERQGLILAWDFVTASTQSLTGRLLAARDQALEANGPGAPPFTITSVEDNLNDHIFRRVRGTFTVPLFMQSARPPTRYNLDENGVPRQNGTANANFIVNIPRASVQGGVARPGRALLYGHGLFGGAAEVNAGWLQTLANTYNFVVAGTDWIGMSSEDLQPTMEFIVDLSGFPALPDRLQQAMINFVLLGRLMKSADGFVSHTAFQLNGEPLIDTQELYYYGNSQGGIQGGTYMAIAPDTMRGVLGVGAANYSMLLQRSVSFLPFQYFLNQVYVDEIERSLLYGLLQQLWDRGEPQGYLPHITMDPLPGTPVKKVLMQIGRHDSSVPDIGAAYQARSLGIPALAPSVWPQFGIPELAAPFDGSAFVVYDVNGTEPPGINKPPTTDNGVHEAVRRLEASRQQLDAFLRPDGRVENFCNGPCFFRGVPDVEERH